MLQLAYNLNGEPFDAPPTMTAWRARKLKKAGAPETAWGLDGLPLFLPMDADIEDLRRESGGETGRFRLDPVDDQRRAIPNAPASYVCVHPLAPAPAAPTAPAAAASAETTSQLVAALLESQKQHTEMARMYVSQFAVVANAMAGVVRSAGDAGLTARVPLVLPAVPETKPAEASDPARETDDDESDESDEDESDEQEAVEVAAEPEEHSWARVGQSFVDHIGPYVGPMLASSPGLAKLLGAHGRKPKTDATTPGPGPSDPAPAGGDAAMPSGPVPGVDAAMLVRLRQVMAQLTPEEEEFARSLIDEISAGDMASWIDRLRAMSIPEAVAYVRTMFRQARAAAGDAHPVSPTAPAAPAAPAAASAPRRAGHPASGRGSSESTAAHRPTSDTSPIRRPVPATQTSDSTTLRDTGTQAHLDQIERSLHTDERTAMRKHFAGLSPSDRSRFVATLLMLPVADAVAVVRGQVGAHPATNAPASPASGDVPPIDVPPIHPPIAAHVASPDRTVSTPARKRLPVSAPSAAAPDVTPPAPSAPAMPATAVAPDPSAAPIVAPSAAPSDAPATVERNAHTHLAEIDSTLAPEERLLVHTMISELSPDDRDAWLDRLVSGSVADGAAMLRAALQTATAERPTANAATGDRRHESATASGARAATTSHELDAGHETDVGDVDALEDGDGLDDGDELERSDEPAAHEPPDASAASHHRPETPPPLATAPTPAIATGAELPTFDADALAHFRAIEEALTLAERMRANELAAQRPAAELRRWYAELVKLSVPEAVAKIRAELARSDNDSHSTEKGGVS